MCIRDSIWAGRDFSIALDEDGNYWGWGDNTLGQLGLGHALSLIHISFRRLGVNLTCQPKHETQRLYYR